jgi:hypothetical protein
LTRIESARAAFPTKANPSTFPDERKKRLKIYKKYENDINYVFLNNNDTPIMIIKHTKSFDNK